MLDMRLPQSIMVSEI